MNAPWSAPICIPPRGNLAVSTLRACITGDSCTISIVAYRSIASGSNERLGVILPPPVGTSQIMAR